MTKRRQALRSQEPLATLFFLSLILIFSFALPSIVMRAEPVSSGAAANEEARVAPDDMNTGALLLQTEEGTFVEAPRLQTDVAMTDVQGSDTAPFGQTPPDANTAGENYPVLPLTVVPKPETNPLAVLKSPSDTLRIAIIALVLTLLSAVSLIVWRHHRRDYASPRRVGRRI
jgi:hypothetical protein